MISDMSTDTCTAAARRARRGNPIVVVRLEPTTTILRIETELVGTPANAPTVRPIQLIQLGLLVYDYYILTHVTINGLKFHLYSHLAELSVLSKIIALDGHVLYRAHRATKHAD